MTTAAGPRTYGNWRRPRGAGLGVLGPLGTGVLLVGAVLVIAALAVAGPLPAAGTGGGVALLLATLVVRDRHGRTGLDAIATRVGWWRTRRRRAHVYRSGPLGPVPGGTCRLPGLLAAARLSEWADGYGRPFALLSLPATGHHTVVLATEPDGASLVDVEQVDSWVAHWGAWLASLGSEPGVVAASVTVETAPDSGARLRAEVDRAVDPRAPLLARTVLAEVVRDYPAGSATVRAFVTVTVSGTRHGRRRPVDEVARDLATRLPGLTLGLAATGAGAVRPATAEQLCEVVRTAYDRRRPGCWTPPAPTASNPGCAGPTAARWPPRPGGPPTGTTAPSR